MDAPSDEDVWTLVGWHVVDGVLWSTLNFRFFFPGLVNNWTRVTVDSSRESWVPQPGVALLSHPPRLRSNVRLLYLYTAMCSRV